MTSKIIVNDGRGPRELLLVSNLVVGRDPVCDLSGEDSLLSRRHAEFVVTPTEVRVRDLGSRNGVYVNGRKVADAALKPGDALAIGHFQIRFVVDQAPLASVLAQSAPPATSGVAPAARTATATPARTTAVSAPVADDDDELTNIVRPPSVPVAVAPASAATDAGDEDEEFTRVVSPPGGTAVIPAPAPSRPASSIVAPAPTPRPPAAAHEDEQEFTRVVMPPTVAFTSSTVVAPAAQGGLTGASAAQASPSTVLIEPAAVSSTSGQVSPAADRTTAAPTRQRPLARLIFVQVGILAVVVAAAASVPFVVAERGSTIAMTRTWAVVAGLAILLVVCAVGLSIHQQVTRAVTPQEPSKNDGRTADEASGGARRARPPR